MKICLYFLTCANLSEANKIAKALLEKHLVVCAKTFPVSSSFLWKGKIDSSKEALLIMESIEENFNKIEKEIKKLHSYKTFVLFSLPILKTTKGVEKWIKTELK